MEYQEFLKQMHQADQLIKTARMKEAEVCLYKLFLSDISDIDKIRIGAALAEVYDHLGNTGEALSWFDKAIDLEHTYSRYEVTEKKAKYLSTLGRRSEGIKVYEGLMKMPFVSEDEKERMRKTVQTLLGQTMQKQQWK